MFCLFDFIVITCNSAFALLFGSKLSLSNGEYKKNRRFSWQRIPPFG